MTKEEFIDLIWDLGFTQAWSSNPDFFIMSVDTEWSNSASYPQLNIHIEGDRFQVSKTQNTNNSITAGPFGNYQLETFGMDGDYQMSLFLGFISEPFIKIPDTIQKHIRNQKIENILK